MNAKMREEFEAWALLQSADIEKFDGRYKSRKTYEWWSVWKASRAVSAVELSDSAIREEFEYWAKSRHMPLRLASTGEYLIETTQSAWEGWEKSREA